MRAGTRLAASLALPAMLSAAPAIAQDDWHCTVLEENDGVRARLTQSYFGPDATREIQPVQEVSASAGGIYFHTSSWPHWRALGMPFEVPRRIGIGIRLPERAASRRISLFAPGVGPISLRARIYGPHADQIGIGIDLDDRRRIEALLTHPDWTLITRYPDGRVQQIVPVRMPMTLARLRALRESQVARMREFQRDPARHCQPAEDPASIVAR
jgi:hypothetical protein